LIKGVPPHEQSQSAYLSEVDGHNRRNNNGGPEGEHR
jgi:hypothetical protein